MTPVVTIYRYRTRPGVSSADYVEAAAKMQETLAATPGFQYRCLVETGEGWLETVFWESAEAAEAANGPVMAAMKGTPWMEMIDMESTKVERHPVVQAGGPPAPAGAANAA